MVELYEAAALLHAGEYMYVWVTYGFDNGIAQLPFIGTPARHLAGPSLGVTPVGTSAIGSRFPMPPVATGDDELAAPKTITWKHPQDLPVSCLRG